MARQAPVTKTPTPAIHFFEWAGGGDGGFVSYYDKNATAQDGTKGANVKCPTPFSFLVLDELATVKGWHDSSDSGIYANEVRDTRGEVFVVKAFKGGVIASGFYSEIRDRVNAAGGYYTATVYVGFKENNQLKIGAIQFKGAALNAWVEFRKEAGGKLWENVVVVTGFVDGKKGSIKFRTPTFALKPVSKETDDAAGLLQEALKAYHVEYFARTRTEQAAHAPAAPTPTPVGEHQQHSPPDAPQQDGPPDQEPEMPPLRDDTDVPF